MKFKSTYLRLLTEKFDEMFDFYSKTIGLPVRHHNPDGYYAEFDAETIRIAIFKSELMAKALGMEHMKCIHECQDKSIIILQVEDVDAVANMLKEKGIFLLSEASNQDEWGVRTVHARDPDGNIIEFNKPISS